MQKSVTIRRTRVVACLLCVAVTPTFAFAQAAQRDSAEIVYIGNEGFFISYAGRGVLIDALVRRGIPPYIRASEEHREQLEKAEPPFDQVQLVLATHDHADHFDAGAIWRHLDYNEQAVFVSTNQAVTRVRATPSTPEIDERTYAAVPPEGSRAEYALEGIDLDVINLHHGRNRNPPVENVGFLVDIEGFHILHVGDAETSVEELMVHELFRDSIDVAFLPYWLLVDTVDRRIVDEAIRPGRIVAMHLPAANAAASYFGSAGTLPMLEAQLMELYPGIVIMRESFDRRRIAVSP